MTFQRADTLDETRNRIGAIRGWGRVEEGGWSLMLDGSYLTSTNRNRLADDPLNRTSASGLRLVANSARNSLSPEAGTASPPRPSMRARSFAPATRCSSEGPIRIGRET
jgi:hypothetical protein